MIKEISFLVGFYAILYDCLSTVVTTGQLLSELVKLLYHFVSCDYSTFVTILVKFVKTGQTLVNVPAEFKNSRVSLRT